MNLKAIIIGVIVGALTATGLHVINILRKRKNYIYWENKTNEYYSNKVLEKRVFRAFNRAYVTKEGYEVDLAEECYSIKDLYLVLRACYSASISCSEKATDEVREWIILVDPTGTMLRRSRVFRGKGAAFKEKSIFKNLSEDGLRELLGELGWEQLVIVRHSKYTS